MKREHLVQCPFCASADLKDLFSQTDTVHKTTQEKFLYARCEACGLVFMRDRPPKPEMAKYYPDAYSFYREGRLEPLKDWLKSLLYRTFYSGEPAFALLRPFLYPVYLPLKLLGALNAIRDYREYPYLPAGDFKLLDVGCGSGTTFHPFGRKYSLLWLKSQGHRGCQGVEPDARACAVAKEHGLQVRPGDLLDSDFADESFDVVRFNHSLEHAHAPEAYLQRAHRLLKRGGRLIVSVPNYDGLVHTLFPDAVEAPRHLFYFSPRCLSSFLEKTGFEVQLVATDPTPEVLAFVLEQKKRNPEGGVPRDFVLRLLPAYRVLAQEGRGDDFNLVARKK